MDDDDVNFKLKLVCNLPTQPENIWIKAVTSSRHARCKQTCDSQGKCMMMCLRPVGAAVLFSPSCLVKDPQQAKARCLRGGVQHFTKAAMLVPHQKSQKMNCLNSICSWS